MLDDRDQEIAETLLRSWKAGKRKDCAERRFLCIANALQMIGAAIQSEIKGTSPDGIAHDAEKLVPTTDPRRYEIKPFSDIIGASGKTADLPAGEALRALVQEYRSAIQDREASEAQVQKL